MNTRLLVVSTSLNPSSRSKLLADAAFDVLSKSGDVDYLDLREVELPLCDGDEAYTHANLPDVKRRIAEADGIIVALPIYNYGVGATTKNLVELTGDAWKDKVVGFLCAAGGEMSYMAVMGLANSMMLDFRCIICPRFVYAAGSAFGEDGLTDADVQRRIEQLCRAMGDLAARVPARQ